MNPVPHIILSCLLSAAASNATISYPGPPPGAASRRIDTTDHLLENAALSARFSPVGASLKLSAVQRAAGGTFSGTDDLFRIHFTDGSSLGSSGMTLTGTPQQVNLAPNGSSPQAASNLPGVALNAGFRNPAGTLEVRWQASLRDGAGYLRQAIEIESLSGNHAIKEITGLYGKLEGSLVSGYTDGSVFTGAGFFAGLETPMSKLSTTSTTSTGTQTVGNWTPALVTPKRMTFPVTLAEGGLWDFLFQYTSGNHRLDTTRVELLDGNGAVVSFDAHAGYTGTASSNNTYTLTVPAAGTYTLGVDCTYLASETNSYGAITATRAVGKTLQAKWPRNLTLSPGTVWKTGAVIGVHPPGQLRRAFLHYLENERAHPYRQFVHYNSWYDLNIGRNENPDPLQRMTEAQTLAVVGAWNQQLYLTRGVRIDGFVWDDGWDDFNSLWGFHAGFPRKFSEINRRSANQQAGIGAWLSPWGGYGSSQAQRIAYWNSTHDPDVSQLHLSNAEYYNAFRDRCRQMLTDYDMRYFKFDGIGAGTWAAGPAAGNEADIDGLLRLLGDLRQQRSDVFINCTVGTWASPFWLLYADSIWRQGEDTAFSGVGNNREQWITYRDNVAYDRFAANSPLFPLNSLMFHGLVVSNYPNTNPALMPLDLQSVTNEIRCATACGSGLQELYASHGLMTPAMWDELAKSLRWLRANADVLPDVHWVGGDPVNGTSQACYGWAAWNSRKGTLALRNPTAATSSITLTLANALELPDGAAASYTALAGYADQRALPGITGASLAVGATLTFELQPFEVLVFDLWPAGATPPAAPLSAAATTPGTFGAWAAAQGIAVTDDPGSRLTDVFATDDDDDGIPNGIEYAFGGCFPLTLRNIAGYQLAEVLAPMDGTSDSVETCVEASGDLISWNLPVSIRPDAPLGTIWSVVPDLDRAFFRVKVELR